MDNLVKVFMPILQGKKEVVIGSKVSQAEFDALSEICGKEDRSMSYVLRELAMRGLSLYKQDGLLKLTEDEEKAITNGKPKVQNKLRPQEMTEAGEGGKVNDAKKKIKKAG